MLPEHSLRPEDPSLSRSANTDCRPDVQGRRVLREAVLSPAARRDSGRASQPSPRVPGATFRNRRPTVDGTQNGRRVPGSGKCAGMFGSFARFLTCALVLVTASHLASLPTAIAQPVPVGPEFQVNTYTTSAQELPAVAPTNAGQFVVVWQSNGGSGTRSDFGIHARWYDNGGAPLGGQFQVTRMPRVRRPTRRSRPAIRGASSSGRASAAHGTDPVNSVQGRRYDGLGLALGAQFQVNSYTTGKSGAAGGRERQHGGTSSSCGRASGASAPTRTSPSRASGTTMACSSAADSR